MRHLWFPLMAVAFTSFELGKSLYLGDADHHPTRAILFVLGWTGSLVGLLLCWFGSAIDELMQRDERQADEALRTDR